MDLTQLKYPRYIQPILGTIVPIEPGSFIEGFEELQSELLIIGQIKGTKYYISDWSIVDVPEAYEARLKRTRILLNYMDNREKYTDLPTDIVNNSNEITEKMKEYLTLGYEGAIIRDVEGFNEEEEENYYEIRFKDRNDNDK